MKSTLQNKWILDSGATAHMTNNKEHLYNVKQSDAIVGFGNQSKQQVSIQGDLDIIFKDKENETIKITVKEVTYVPDLLCNLISLPKAKMMGFKINDEEEDTFIYKNEIKLTCTEKILSGQSYLMAFNARTTPKSQSNISTALVSNYQGNIHYALGHPGVECSIKTGKKLGEIFLEKE